MKKGKASKAADRAMLALGVAIGTPSVVLLGLAVYAVGHPLSTATHALVAVLKSSPF